MKAMRYSEDGNKKLGKMGKINRVPLKTCPNSTESCREVCYANKPPQLWHHDKYDKLREKPEIGADVVRLHPSGDFANKSYIKWIMELVRENQDTKFFGYTRDWRNDDLKEVLDELRDEPNVQLWASMDKDIDKVPSDWNKAWLETDDRAKGFICPEQTGDVESCRDCGICYNENIDKDVIFKIH